MQRYYTKIIENGFILLITKLGWMLRQTATFRVTDGINKSHWPVCKANQFSSVIDHSSVIANANINTVVMSV